MTQALLQNPWLHQSWVVGYVSGSRTVFTTVDWVLSPISQLFVITKVCIPPMHTYWIIVGVILIATTHSLGRLGRWCRWMKQDMIIFGSVNSHCASFKDPQPRHTEQHAGLVDSAWKISNCPQEFSHKGVCAQCCYFFFFSTLVLFKFYSLLLRLKFK